MSRIEILRRELTTPLTTLQGELNRVLRSYWGAEGPAGETETGSETSVPSPTWVPELDLAETPVEFGLWVDLPGVDPDTIELSVTGRTLTLRGQKPAEPRPGHFREHVSERLEGRFHRVLELPGDIDPEAIQAEARHGVLHVRIAKAANNMPRTIPVRAERSSTEPAAVETGETGATVETNKGGNIA
ncbi:Hsp20/alpha crystallin family protein [soil metagenome]